MKLSAENWWNGNFWLKMIEEIGIVNQKSVESETVNSNTHHFTNRLTYLNNSRTINQMSAYLKLDACVLKQAQTITRKRCILLVVFHAMKIETVCLWCLKWANEWTNEMGDESVFSFMILCCVYYNKERAQFNAIIHVSYANLLVHNEFIPCALCWDIYDHCECCCCMPFIFSFHWN